LAFPGVDSLYREDQFYIGGTFHINSELGVGTAIKFTVSC